MRAKLEDVLIVKIDVEGAGPSSSGGENPTKVLRLDLGDGCSTKIPIHDPAAKWLNRGIMISGTVEVSRSGIFQWKLEKEQTGRAEDAIGISLRNCIITEVFDGKERKNIEVSLSETKWEDMPVTRDTTQMRARGQQQAPTSAKTGGNVGKEEEDESISDIPS